MEDSMCRETYYKISGDSTILGTSEHTYIHYTAILKNISMNVSMNFKTCMIYCLVKKSMLSKE